MGWVNLSIFFWAALDTAADKANDYALDPTSLFAIYPNTAKIYQTSTALTKSTERLQYIDVYMDDLFCSTQGGAAQKPRVLELTLYILKEIPPSVPGEIKDSEILKKGLAGDGE